MSLEWQERRLLSFGLPENLEGSKVLDIGPWDGYFTFEMERRGAQVTAIDYVDLDTFRALHSAFGSRASYHRLDVYELDPTVCGQFDITLCLGILYHLKHPLLALEKICSVTTEICIIDTYVVDGEARQEGITPPLPYVEFYERAELGDQLDNWSGPTVSAVEAWIRAAGFAEAEVLSLTSGSACVAAYRHWRNLPKDESPAIKLIGVNCHLHRGASFRTRKEEYLEMWCAWEPAIAPSLDAVYPEVDGFGVSPLSASITPNGLLVNSRLPPGLSPGRHCARIKIDSHSWSEPCPIYVDLPSGTDPPVIVSIQDGIQWTYDQVDWANGGWVTLWVDGLSAEADAGNTTVFIAGIPHFPDAVVHARRQVNVRLRPVVRAGVVEIAVSHRDVTSVSREIRVIGSPPSIKGLELLAASW